MKKAIWLIVPLIMFVLGTASAEFYKYTDQEGNVRFTDDLSQVPEDQRPDVTRYDDSKPVPPAPVAKPTPKPAVKKSPKPQSTGTTGIDAREKELQAKKSSLDKEFQALMKEDAALQEEKKNLTTRRQIEAYNRKIGLHNDKLIQWQQNQEAFNAEVKVHNANVAERSRRAKQQP